MYGGVSGNVLLQISAAREAADRFEVLEFPRNRGRSNKSVKSLQEHAHGEAKSRA